MSIITGQDTAKTRRTLSAGGAEYAYYSIPAAEAAGLGSFARLPASLKVVLENMLRFEDGKTVTVDFQAPARDSSDEKPGDGKNDVIASGKVSNNPKSGVLGNTGAAITIAALAIAMLAAIAMIVKTAKISR